MGLLSGIGVGAFLLISQAAFGGIYNQSSLPREEVALLVSDSRSSVAIRRIDGATKGVPSSGTYEFLPGKHCIRVDYRRQIGRTTWSSNTIIDFYFYAAKGARLKTVCEDARTGAEHGTWRFWIEDTRTGKPLVMTGYDVSLLPDPDRQEEPGPSLVDVVCDAMKGQAEAQYQLGYCYENGKGAGSDLDEAVRWYSQSAQQGYAKAEAALGRCYLNGHGVFQDFSEAHRWIKIAVEKGDDSAKLHLGDCYAGGKGVAQDFSEAAKWYQQSGYSGNAEAQGKLGELFASGNGVEKDLVKAHAWLSIASQRGYTLALIPLSSLERQDMSPEQLEAAKALAKSLLDGMTAKQPRP